MKYRNAEWTSLEHLRIKVTAPTKNTKTTAEIHNIVYNVSSYVCVGILKSWIRKRVIKDFCLNVQIQRKLHASRQRSIKMFCSSTIICSVCFVRKSLFQIGNKWSAIEFLFLNEATSQTAFLYPGWSPYRYFREISAVFFISEKKEIQRYITNRKLLVFLFFLIWDCRQNYNAKLGYICNTESPKTWLGKRGVSKKNYWDFVIFATEYIFLTLRY